jgi:pyridoxal phosphate enzyme (YggS family)
VDRETLRRNLDAVGERMARAAERSGRAGAAVRLMAVTKTLPVELAQAAIAEGVTLFGENRVQEALGKWGSVPEGTELHLIGHLQRNKAKLATGLFSCVQSLDKVETARELSRYCVQAGRRCDVLLEVNTSGEQSKSGVEGREELLSLLADTLELPALRVRGLMTVGPLTLDERATRLSFGKLRGLLEEARNAAPAASLDVLSMGMSGDFEAAIEEGSTLVRLGTALFGPRAV